MLDNIAGTFEHRRTISGRRCIPGAKGGLSGGECGSNDRFITLLYGTNSLTVDRRFDGPFPPSDGDAVDEWFCVRASRFRLDFGKQGFERSIAARSFIHFKSNFLSLRLRSIRRSEAYRHRNSLIAELPGLNRCQRLLMTPQRKFISSFPRNPKPLCQSFGRQSH